MEKAGAIAPVEVEGIRGPLYILAEDLPLIKAVIKDEIDRKERLEFLAPLDPMMWDRKLIEAVWGYKYSWEIYTPPAIRKYGYYVLPMLYGQELIGRIEAIANKKKSELEVRNIWYEQKTRQTKKLSHAIDSCIVRLAQFNECNKISGR